MPRKKKKTLKTKRKPPDDQDTSNNPSQTRNLDKTVKFNPKPRMVKKRSENRRYTFG